MNRAAVLLWAIVICAAGAAAYAEYSVADKGTWPRSWPKELESLRQQARSLVGPKDPKRHYEIPFTTREEFEAAWPHILKVKSKGAPVILVRGPNKWVGAPVKAGVRIHAPPEDTDTRANPEQPLPGQHDARTRWMWTTYVVLVVDGQVVDLNRIPLPEDTPIIDERFKN
jgi:hypothetical protein